mmetsp:Transcript_7081/g.18031  ORF Transcript_7081/g.18031 Transcript_7081/m.18031 type:complete len:80 (-) Transcript_7081:106-345(-)
MPSSKLPAMFRCPCCVGTPPLLVEQVLLSLVVLHVLVELPPASMFAASPNRAFMLLLLPSRRRVISIALPLRRREGNDW